MDAYPILDVTSTTSEYNAQRHVIKTAQDAQMTCTIVKVKKVTTTGDVAPIGQVSVQPLVQMVDGVQRPYSHETVFNLPYIRIVGGAKAIIMDPKVGDIGMVFSCDRDIQKVKAKKDVAPPGSLRRYNIADGIYIGCAIADKPTSYVQFKDNGTIIVGVGSNPATACEAVVASDHVQMKKKGSPTLHITVNVAAGQLQCGMDFVVVNDPFPND